MKYIDAEKLAKAIEDKGLDCSFALKMERIDTLALIDSLQQEQPDIDEIKREWYNKGYLEGRKNAHIPARELGLPKSWDFQDGQPEVDLKEEIASFFSKNPIPHEHITDWPLLKNTALHFYELGKLNARKQE